MYPDKINPKLNDEFGQVRTFTVQGDMTRSPRDRDRVPGQIFFVVSLGVSSGDTIPNSSEENSGHVPTSLSGDTSPNPLGRRSCGQAVRGSEHVPPPRQKNFIPAPHTCPHTHLASLARRVIVRRYGGTERGQLEVERDARFTWGNRRPDRVRRLSVEQPTWLSGGASTPNRCSGAGRCPHSSITHFADAGSPRFCIDLCIATALRAAG